MPRRRKLRLTPMQRVLRYGDLAVESYEGSSANLKRVKIRARAVQLRKKDKKIYEPKKEEELLGD